MDAQRLKIKIGIHEFEAEGPPDVVQSQFEAFRELVADMSPSRQIESIPDDSGATLQNDLESTDSRLEKVMRVNDRIVSLTVGADSIDDAVLLLIYGQKVLLENETVTGHQLMGGLKISGQAVSRVDRQLKKAAAEGAVIIIGKQRSKKYRITNKGILKARKMARELIETVA